jgi:histidyl-tRNA synthetase
MMIEAPPKETPTAVIIPLGELAQAAAQRLLAELRRDGVKSDMAYRGAMKKRLSRANDAGAKYVVIIGDDELERGEVQLKNLATGEQNSVELARVRQALG